MAIRKRIYEVLAVAVPGDRFSRVVDIGILCLILLNVAALILETVPEYQRRHGDLFTTFENVSLAIFAVEYLLRLWSCVDGAEYRRPFRGRLRFASTPLVVIDLLAVLPALLGFDTRFVRILRLLKLARYIEPMRMLQRVVVRKRTELLVAVIIIGIAMVFTACLIFAVEEGKPGFESIPQAMWWSIITLTTVGYGDASPQTPLGQLLAGIVAVMGIAMFALPTSILGAAFVEEINKKQTRRVCPHCGKVTGR